MVNLDDLDAFAAPDGKLTLAEADWCTAADPVRGVRLPRSGRRGRVVGRGHPRGALAGTVRPARVKPGKHCGKSRLLDVMGPLAVGR